jgi:hypothetical protein
MWSFNKPQSSNEVIVINTTGGAGTANSSGFTRPVFSEVCVARFFVKCCGGRFIPFRLAIA